MRVSFDDPCLCPNRFSTVTYLCFCLSSSSGSKVTQLFVEGLQKRRDIIQKIWLLLCVDCLEKHPGTLCVRHPGTLYVCHTHTRTHVWLKSISEVRTQLYPDRSALRMTLPWDSGLYCAAEHVTPSGNLFKGSSRVWSNNWGSPIIVKANKTLTCTHA